MAIAKRKEIMRLRNIIFLGVIVQMMKYLLMLDNQNLI